MQKFQNMLSDNVQANFCFTRKGWVISVSNFFKPYVCDIGVWEDKKPQGNSYIFNNVNEAIDFVDSQK